MKLLDKIKSWFSSDKSSLSQDWYNVLLEIFYRLETTNYNPNTTRFDRYNIAVNLTKMYYKSSWRSESYTDFDDHITRYLDEVYPTTYIKPFRMLMTAEQCRFAIIISEYLMESLFNHLGWDRDDIQALSIQLAVNFEYDKSLKDEVSLYDQIDMYMESPKVSKITEEYASIKHRMLNKD